MEAVAINCCENGVAFFSREKPETVTLGYDEFSEIGTKLLDARRLVNIADEMQIALEEIASWRNDTLGARPKEQTENDCPPAQTDAFDRGCRMAFYRCAERALLALKEWSAQ